MKYSNSLKYINSFARAQTPSELSRARVRKLCERLGRIGMGARYICLPDGSAGHACAVLLEEIMVSANHSVGRVCLNGVGVRESAWIGGECPSIEDFNLAVAELKSAVQKDPDEGYLLEEAKFVLGLLLCRMSGCEYIILEGVGSGDAAIESVCAPYELIIIPTVCGDGESSDTLKRLCESIKRGCREVVSGNQKREVYNQISNACATSGVRLCIPVKAQFEIVELSARKMAFNYCGREGFSMKSPSKLLRDAAMTVIESGLALRRGGIKLPWSSISAGISSEAATGCFDIWSMSPLMLSDTAEDSNEVALLFETADEIWGKDVLSASVLCIDKGAFDAVEAFRGKNVEKVLVFGGESVEGNEEEFDLVGFSSVKSLAKELKKLYVGNSSVICLGNIEFINELKTEFSKLM